MLKSIMLNFWSIIASYLGDGGGGGETGALGPTLLEAPAKLSKEIKILYRTVSLIQQSDKRYSVDIKLYWDKLLKSFSHSILEGLILSNQKDVLNYCSKLAEFTLTFNLRGSNSQRSYICTL